MNKRFSTWPSSGGGSGVVTISRRAVSSISGSPVSGFLALLLAARFGGGLEGLGALPATGSTTLPGGRQLLQRGTNRSHPIRSLSSPDDHCSQRIQSVSRSEGGSSPRDDLYSSECQWRPGHLDEPQRQISSEDLVT